MGIRSIMGANCEVAADDAEDDKENNSAVQEDRWTCAADTGAAVDEIIIESMSNPSFNWLVQNDPVMGGASFSSLTMMEDEGTAFFTGEVKNIPFLGLPGFIQMEARGGKGTYPDVSCCDSLKLTLMGMEEYTGYRVSFGTKRSKRGFFAQGFKADFDLPSPAGEYGEVTIPFNMFSVEWDEATGDQIVTCEEDPSVCPDLDTLRNMETVAIWGEGVGGQIELQVKSISAVGCSGDGEIQFTTTGEDIPPRTNEAIKEWKTENDALSNESSSSMNMIPLLVGLCSLVSTLFLLSD